MLSPLTRTIALLLIISSSNAFADEYYPTADDVIAHFYQKGDKENYPWHKKTKGEDDAEALDYSICYNKLVSPQPPQHLIVMCSDPSQREYDNAPLPTDYYILGKVAQGFSLLATEQDSGNQFQDVITIGHGKWAIHDSASAMNQGYGQTHDTLSIVTNGEFIPVAQWTSWLDNTGAFDPDEKGSEGQAESMENALSVDDGQKDADFYPLLIHSTGFNGSKKFDKKYTIKFSVDAGKYVVPDELNGGY
ncbi:conserved exported hypothetical protein [Enterobacterales bacterium 8AC]|nr:conserved exported hypothetical protein [Enterobacterales bacterium 8AC]